MDAQTLNRFHKILDRLDNVLSERIAQRRGAGTIAGLVLRARQMRNTVEHEAAVRRLGYQTALLVRVKAAIRRIRQGGYGTCLSCHNPISQRHLNAVPWAAFCIPCRRAIDSAEAVPATHRQWVRSVVRSI